LTREAAEDATQETFLLAAERLADIQQERERAFLIGTALRLAHTLNRKTVRWELDEDMDQRFSEARDTGDTRADQQICDLVLSKVDPDLVEVFVLYELEGLTAPEIAGLLEIPLGSVASRLRRAREQFRSAAERVEKILQREGQS
jgi:RNA polymerase sigma-70 factor (ECF subfamily)